MSVKVTRRKNVYGWPAQPQQLFPDPEVNQRDPVSGQYGDAGTPGQLWVNESVGSLFGCVKNKPFSSWIALEASGGMGNFSTINSTGVINLATTGAGTNVIGNNNAGSFTEIIGGNSQLTVAQGGMVFAGPSFSYGGGNIVLNTGCNFSVASNTNTISIGTTVFSTGSGVPAGALATAVGCVYINQTAASATTRMYIATAVGTWTNVTCAL